MDYRDGVRGAIHQPRRARDPDPTYRLGLIGGFSLRRDRLLVRLAIGAQRLLAFVALSDRPVHRSQVAGTFWPDVGEERAMANLRSVIWRIGRPASDVLIADGGLLSLRPDVVVDLREATRSARDVLARRDGTSSEFETLVQAGELLPDWSEEWVLVDRERYHQLRLHALERLGQQLADNGRYGLAVETCLAAIAAEPLRESAQRQLIEVYLSEGNRVDAIRQYSAYERTIREEIGVEPAFEIADLLRPLEAAAAHDH